ncbi:MAG: hypothetical protein LBI96_04030 [Odoribacteraceae bacterium]|jgi:hypothetical protein|nr:hypothetical protein [Odoribacteraceae bacterium]
MKHLLHTLAILALVSCHASPAADETEDTPQVDETPEAADETRQQDDYYLYHGIKIPLHKMDNKFYMVFYTANLDKIKDEVQKAGATLEEVSQPMVYSTGTAAEKFVDCEALVVKGDHEKVEAILSQALYRAPFYMSDDGEEMGMTEMFSVVLKPGTTLEQLETLARDNSVETIGFDPHIPTWYHFACTTLSKGNSLDMSTLFRASGLFTDTFPNRILHIRFDI